VAAEWSGRPDSNRGPLAPKISPTHLNACVSNAPSAAGNKTRGGFVPKLFPTSAPRSGTLEHATQTFAEALRRDFAGDINRDPRFFKKQVLRLIRRWLPPRPGRPTNPKTEAAFALLQEGKTVRQILRLQIRDFDKLDTWSRMLAEKGLRQALARRGRGQAPGRNPNSPR
jgi:hypothetical protein